MKLTNLFTKTTKDIPSDETSKNAQLLIRAGFVHKTMAGVYAFLPLGLRVLNNIENIVRKHLNRIGGQEILMNSLHPKIWWEKTNRWEGVDILFKLKSQTNSEYALACSHEEQVTPVVGSFINSWKDLPQYSKVNGTFPLSVYQIQTKFRDELRAKSGLLRGREFRMKDMYDFHINKESQDEYYEIVKETYLKIYSELGLKVYSVQASGGIFTENESHEFQAVCGAGEDEILYSESDGFAINSEIYDEYVAKGGKAPAKETLKKAVSAEVGNIFKLDDKYTKPFEVSINDKDNKPLTPLMNCHGLGTSRVLGVIAEIYNDEKGLKWPESVAPFKYHLITNKEKDETLNKQILDLASKFYSGNLVLVQKENGEFEFDDITDFNFPIISKDPSEFASEHVLWDNRENASIGEKLKDADLIGCPIQLVISKRSLENGGVEVRNRNSGKSKVVAV